MLTEAEIRYMTTNVSKDLVSLLMERYSLSLENALDTLYNSETYQKLLDPNTGLYFQSPKYVFSYLDNEINFGKMK